MKLGVSLDDANFFRKSWFEAYQMVKTQDPYTIEVPSVESLVTVEQVTTYVEGRVKNEKT